MTGRTQIQKPPIRLVEGSREKLRARFNITEEFAGGYVWVDISRGSVLPLTKPGIGIDLPVIP